jgi:predicted RNase H-like HicB family nuclease
MMTYRAVYEREHDGRWIVKVPEVPGCHSYGRTIEQARDRIRKALGLFVDDADTAQIVDKVRLPAKVKKLVSGAVKLRAKVVDQQDEMVAAQIGAVKALRQLNLGHRDAGTLLGLSHQRVHQLEKHRNAGRVSQRGLEMKRPGANAIAPVGARAARPPL